jgi:hypothetical protein
MTTHLHDDANAGIRQRRSATPSLPGATNRIPQRAHAARSQWRQLLAASHSVGVFAPGDVRSEPKALQRWLNRALAPDLPLGTAVQLSMHGQLKLRDAWCHFAADQLIVPGRGYVWAATTSVGGLPCNGFDSFVNGVGQMRWKLFGVLPVVTATGEDVSRSAAGRLAVECVVAPTGFRSASWTDTADPDVVRGHFSSAGYADDVDLRIDADGNVVSVSMLRWGAEDGPALLREFGADAAAHATVGGFSLPTKLRVGWDWGTERWATGEFFRAEITDARLLTDCPA